MSCQLRRPNVVGEMDELRKLPWREPRPGVFYRRLDRPDYLLMERRFACQDCGTDDPSLLDYMVGDELWRRACPEDGFLCVSCLETRLGRSLVIDDLNLDSPMYRLIFRLLGKYP